jgi:hypothetical protein
MLHDTRRTDMSETTLRVYTRVGEEVAMRLLDGGRWEDLHTDLGYSGVWCDNRPRGGVRAAAGSGIIAGGPGGTVTLYAEIPESIFSDREVRESIQELTPEDLEQIDAGGPDPDGLEYQHMGYAIIPAVVLNEFGPPRLYDHVYAGASRAELIRSLRAWEDRTGNDHYMVKWLRAAVAFLDHVGWQTPVSLREKTPADPLAPGPWFGVDEIEEAGD